MSKKENGRLWTKNFIIVSCINFLVILIFYLLMVTIARYATEAFGASTSMAGLVASIYILGVLFGRLVTGRLITGWGSRKTLMIGLVFLSLATLLYFVSFNLVFLTLIRLFHGMATGVVSTATGTIVAQIVPSRRRGEGIGYFTLSAVLASAIGPFVGMLLTQIYDHFSVIFIMNTILIAFCVGTFFLLDIKHVGKNMKTVQNTAKGFSLSNYIEPKALPISIVSLFVGFAYSGVMSFLSFYSEEINLIEAGSLFFLFYSIAILVSRPFSGPLMDRKGANVVMYPALAVFAVGMAFFSQANTTFVFLLAALLMGLGYGNFTSVAQAMAVKVTEPHRYGLATSTFFIMLDLGLGLGPYLLGYLVPAIGYRGLFTYMVPVIVLSLVLYGVLVGRREKSLRAVAN